MGRRAGGRQATTRRLTVRTQILGWVLLLSFGGVVVSGVLTHLVQRDAARDRVDAGLLREVEELRRLIANGPEPSGGGAFRSVEEAVRSSLVSNVPNANEALLAVVDDQVVLGPNRGRAFRPDQDADFLREVSGVPPGAQAQPRSLDIGGREVRYIAVPVTGEGADSRAVYVVAVDLEAELDEVDAASARAALTDLATLAVVALAAWLVAGRVLRPLRRLRATARRISATDLTERLPVSGQDELADLSATFNDMLDRLDDGVRNQGQFLDDAGHELRTPLTILRGHLEVLEPSDEAQVAETQVLLLDEVERMSRLVNDLVLLARARRLDFVRVEDVAVRPLLEDARAKADGLSSRRWVLDEAPDISVRADPQRLTQALMQLASNAVRFTSGRDVVAMGGEVSGEMLLLWVRDTGPGVDPADHGRIFDRFGRAAQAHGADGSGLGLSIVAAIAEAHGGRVEIDSRLGRGARFTLVLPLHGPSTSEPVATGSGPGDLRPWERA